MSISYSLTQLGWRSFYSQQLALEDLDVAWPARVASVHRNSIVVLGERGEFSATLASSIAAEAASTVTVGDWVMVENDAPRISRVLERASLIARLTAGTRQHTQAIAANLDTLFIVTSCNEDFNPSRLERYLAVAQDARVEPVIVVTKVDLHPDVGAFVEAIARIAPSVTAILVNARTDETSQLLAPWLGAGKTVGFVGSSGVGKSTLVNTLCGSTPMATGHIRDDDAKGRHTTTSRQLIAMSTGAWLIDTPGMRELKLGAIEAAVTAVFADVEALAQTCRFRDCSHQGNTGCALAVAIASGQIDQRRVTNYLKLQREAARAGRTIRERHQLEQKFGRMRKAQKTSQKLRDGG